MAILQKRSHFGAEQTAISGVLSYFGPFPSLWGDGKRGNAGEAEPEERAATAQRKLKSPEDDNQGL